MRADTRKRSKDARPVAAGLARGFSRGRGCQPTATGYRPSDWPRQREQALAWMRANASPRDIILLALAEDLIGTANSAYYAPAVEWLEEARRAYARLGREAEWQARLDDLVQRHRRKRNLMRLLRERGWLESTPPNKTPA